MRTLRFIVDGQIIMADPGCDFSDLIPGSEKYLQAEFLFSPDWDGLSKTAVFYSALGYKYEPQTLSDGKTCIIPADALKKRIFKVQVCGENTDGSIVPTNKIIVAQTGNSVTTPSTPSTAIKLLTELYLNTTFGPDSAYNANVINAVIQDILESKQDNLVSGENIKTINGQSVVGSGDIPIEGGSGSEFNIVEVSTDGEFEPTDIYNAIGMNEVIIGLLAMIDEIEPSIIAKFDTVFKTKQDLLVSGENIKTINGQSILAEGNIAIEGGSDEELVEVLETTLTDDVAYVDLVAPDNKKFKKLHIMIATQTAGLSASSKIIVKGSGSTNFYGSNGEPLTITNDALNAWAYPMFIIERGEFFPIAFCSNGAVNGNSSSPVYIGGAYQNNIYNYKNNGPWKTIRIQPMTVDVVFKAGVSISAWGVYE